MPALDKPYVRLNRSPVNLGGYHQLWQGPDHLLQVKSTGYSESYQRYDYSEIQGFVLSPSSRRTIWLGIWLIPALVSGGFVLAGLLSGEIPWVALIFFLPPAALLLSNWLLGPTVRVQILTQIGLAEIPSLVRKRKAETVLARIRSAIEAQDGPHQASSSGQTSIP